MSGWDITKVGQAQKCRSAWKVDRPLGRCPPDAVRAPEQPHSWDVETTLRPGVGLDEVLVQWGLNDLGRDDSLVAEHFDLVDLPAAGLPAGAAGYLHLFGRWRGELGTVSPWQGVSQSDGLGEGVPHRRQDR